MDFSLLLKTYFVGVEVGTDEFGNRYYVHKNNPHKRWVLFKGKSEASAVPPAWHGFLHGNLDAPLDEQQKPHFSKPHMPNMTGTCCAHTPKDTTSRTKDYDAWSPGGR